MKYTVMLSLGITAFLMSSSAMAGQPAEKMDRQLCSVCHGPGGTTSSELFPHLAAEPAPYIVAQMKAFRDKSRSDQNAKRFMWGISSRLTDEDIDNLAAYYEAQPAVHQGKVSDQAKYDAGKAIFTQGNADKGVPPCMACHGEKAEGMGATPRLGGQNENYLKRQLKVFAGVERPAAVAMHEIVKGLTEKDIDSLAHFLQAQ